MASSWDKYIFKSYIENNEIGMTSKDIIAAAHIASCQEAWKIQEGELIKKGNQEKIEHP